jgi:ppGpp synthetase/RelA/SpoT-type nucleotidyltranferase
MDLIEDFIARYRKEFDFYDQAARLAAQTLEVNLQAAGIRSMVTYRPKALGRLEAKCRQRASTKRYTTVDDIYKDIVDLAGTRVALYFPAEREQVDKLIKQYFVLLESPLMFPAPATSSSKKRFSGYWATHYRVQLKESMLTEAHKRYAEARIEIQVASVLMHAWSEVEHDLVYKPLEGTLSEEEYAILDELNGMVIVGELALERLQKAGEARVAAGGRHFANHYDLAAHILNRTAGMVAGPLGDSALGRIDLLFNLLTRLNLATPDQLTPYIEALHTDTERRPIADQIIDRLLADDDSRYKVYEEVRTADKAFLGIVPGEGRFMEPGIHEAMGFFLSQWIELERLVRRPLRDVDPRGLIMPTGKVLERIGLHEPETLMEIERIRRLRNNLVHGIEVPDSGDLLQAGQRLQAIVASLKPRLE